MEVTVYGTSENAIYPDESLFCTAHTIYSLTFLPEEKTKEIIEKALRFFLSEKNSVGMWRFWNKSFCSPILPINIPSATFIPIDLDDTSMISFLIEKYLPNTLNNKKLFLFNRDKRGLFYTWFLVRLKLSFNFQYWKSVLIELNLARLTIFWIKTEADYDDIDSVVNANILTYLGEQEVTKPIVTWIYEILETHSEVSTDKWYLSPFPFYYAVSRAYHNGAHSLEGTGDTILERLTEVSDSSGRIGNNVLETALSCCTLLNLKKDSPLVAKGIAYILSQQQANGSWPSEPFYFGGPKKFNSWGSAELTTGFCLEALQRYL